jgi:hypothetical protein
MSAENATIETVHAEAPVAETPVAEAPVAETPVAETPVAETPVAEEKVEMDPQNKRFQILKLIASTAVRNVDLLNDAIKHWNEQTLEQCQAANEEWPQLSQKIMTMSQSVKTIEELRDWRVNHYVPFMIRTMFNPLFYMMIPTNKVYSDLVQ